MKKIQLATLIWVKSCLNYPDIREVIRWICERTQKEWLREHLYNKFGNYYNLYTSNGAMTTFYCELDTDLREALVEYALTEWAFYAMPATYREYCKL